MSSRYALPRWRPPYLAYNLKFRPLRAPLVGSRKSVYRSIEERSREDREHEVTSMTESKELLTTTQKARTINFDAPMYGTFAEIGAGQEVAREFFHAGGAAGTIAKSISAYDMVFSEPIYARAPR